MLLSDAVLQPDGGPSVDVITMAKVDLRAGTTLDGLGGYHTYGEAESHRIVRSEGLLPMGLAEGCTLVRDVPVDTVISWDDVDVPPGRGADRLRAEQDARWSGESLRHHPPSASTSK